MTAAQALRPGDALMPLYRDLVRGYETVYQPIDGYLNATHRLADEWNLRHNICQETPGTHRHHVDFNRRNNQPINIARLEASQHIRLHNRENYGENFDPREHGSAISIRMVQAWSADDGTRRSSQAEIARRIRLRAGITEESVRRALDDTGSRRGAAP